MKCIGVITIKTIFRFYDLEQTGTYDTFRLHFTLFFKDNMLI